MIHLRRTSLITAGCLLLGAACSTEPGQDPNPYWQRGPVALLGTDQNPAQVADARDAAASVSVSGGDAAMAPAEPATGHDAGKPSAHDAGLTREPDAGTPGSTEEDAGVPIIPEEDPAFSGPTVCTSGTTWQRGNDGSELMRPGHACVDCHRGEEEAPIYSIAGTLYPTGHEPDDCNGVNGGTASAQVELSDAQGKVVRLTPNAAGNFFTRTSFTFPVLAKVLYQGRERAMGGEISAADGDCNGCHTPNGSRDAPGRITLP